MKLEMFDRGEDSGEMLRKTVKPLALPGCPICFSSPVIMGVSSSGFTSQVFNSAFRCYVADSECFPMLPNYY